MTKGRKVFCCLTVLFPVDISVVSNTLMHSPASIALVLTTKAVYSTSLFFLLTQDSWRTGSANNYISMEHCTVPVRSIDDEPGNSRAWLKTVQ